MKIRLVTSLLVLFCGAAAAYAQTELTIKKRSTIKIPGMETMPKVPSGASNPLEDRTSTVYIKGARMRTDRQEKVAKMSVFLGSMKTVTFSHILQCDTLRYLSFSSDKKKYYQEALGGSGNIDKQKLKKGGYVTISGGVTDTGNRSKLFGYDAKHLKQTMTITPAKGACMKETLTIETEGWYIDLPEFVCPMKRSVRDFQIDSECYDEAIDEVKGVITGFALKEIKKIEIQGQTITVEEEVVSLSKTTLADSLFDVPANYVPANSLKEIQEEPATETNSPSAITANSSSADFPMPRAGIEPTPVLEKKPGMIRIGVLKPKVTTPESKNNELAGVEMAMAARNYLVETLKAENVEAIPLEAEEDAKAKDCDYILSASVLQKKGGGGMFKSMILMGATSVIGGMIPGVGGVIGSTVAGQVMGQTMGKAAKAKEEFSLEYKVIGTDKTVLFQSGSKKKAEKDGDDVLSPQLYEASVKILDALAKKQTERRGEK